MKFNEELLLCLIGILYMFLFQNRFLFFQIIFSLSFIFNFKGIFRKPEKVKDLLKIPFAYLISYFIIMDPNPLYHFFFFFLPFQNLFRGIFIIMFTSYCISPYQDFMFRNIFSKFFSSKKMALISICIFSFIHFCVFMYHQKYFIYFVNKDKLVKHNDKFYIVAILKNISPIMNDYLTEMKKLISYLGEENVYVSIMENGDSNDTTAIGLRNFGEYLDSKNIPNKIVTEHILNLTIYDDRVERLIDLRNYAMNYLYELGDKIKYNETKIIFFNDIIFNYQDVINLLSTNNGDYDAVCGMDYYESFYDVWVSIGLDGHQTRRYFPFFINKNGADAYINGEPIRVFSCWNGLFLAKAEPFEKRHIKFRFSFNRRESECTLLCADFYSNGYGKILLNPNIIFAYTYEYYYKNKYIYFWGKHLFTYFYYYVQYNPWKKRFRRNKNMLDFKATMGKMEKYLEANYLYYYQNYLWL